MKVLTISWINVLYETLSSNARDMNTISLIAENRYSPFCLFLPQNYYEDEDAYSYRNLPP